MSVLMMKVEDRTRDHKVLETYLCCLLRYRGLLLIAGILIFKVLIS